MSKRIYIAAGTIAVRSLIKLYERYEDSNLFQSDEYRDDQFIGLETDLATIERLRRLAPTNRNIVGIQVQSERAGSSVRQLVQAFRPDWDCGSAISPHGVGGDRTLSMSPLDWTTADNGALRVRLASLATGGMDNVVVLLGTAFGGTATGLFWNLASWIRAQIPLCNEGGQTSRAQFFAFVVLPDSRAGAARTYPWTKNFCGFMQDMQTLEMATRIRRTNSLQNAIPFLFPDFVSYNGNLEDRVPMWIPGVSNTDSTCRLSEHSHLPVDRLFFVPPENTRQGGVPGQFTSETLSEQIFLFGALDGWKNFRVLAQTIDAFGAHGAYGSDYGKPELSFGGFNMVAGISAKHAILASRYWAGLKNALENFSRPGVKVADQTTKTELTRVLEDRVFHGDVALDTDAGKEAFLDLVEGCGTQGVSTAGQQQRADDILAQVRRNLQENRPQTWLVFEEFLAEVAMALHDKTGSDQWRFTLDDLVDVYVAAREKIRHDSAAADSIRSQIRALMEKFETELKRRKESSFVSVLAAEKAVGDELKEDFVNAELRQWDHYVRALGAEALLQQIPDDDAFRRELDKERELLTGSIQKEIQDGQRMAEIGNRQSFPAFISCESSSNVALGDHFKPAEGLLLRTLLGANCARDGNARADIFEAGEKDCLKEFQKEDRNLRAASPLRHLPVRFSETCKAFSDVMAGPDALEWHDHFWVSYGDVSGITWQQLTDFSPDFSTFKTLHPSDQPIGMDSEIDVSKLMGDYFFADIHESNQSQTSVQGSWIGTLQLDKDVRSILQKAYVVHGVSLADFDSDVWNSELTVRNPPRNLLRLPEMMAYGCVFGVLEKKIKALTIPQGASSLTVLMEQAKVNRIFSRPDFEYFFDLGNEGTSFSGVKNVPMDWIRLIGDWIRDSFWTDLGSEALSRELNEIHYQALGRMNLSIRDSVKEGLSKLTQNLERFISVSVE